MILGNLNGIQEVASSILVSSTTKIIPSIPSMNRFVLLSGWEYNQ